jgi:hypothetical protein
MASKYWVGGDGNWSSLTNWRTTSGGAVVTTPPILTDAAILDANSSTSVVTVDSNITVQTLTCTGFTGTLAFGTNTISLNSTGTIFTGATTMTVTGTPQIICTNSSATARTISPAAVTEANSISFRITAGTGTFTITTSQGVRDLDFTDGVNPTGYAGALQGGNVNIYGNLKVSTGMTVVAGTGIFNFNATSGTKTINTAGVTFDRPFTFNGVGGTWQLQSNLIAGPSPAGVDSTRTTTLTAGTLDVNGYTLTTGLIAGTGSSVRSFVTNSVPIVVTGSGASVVNFGGTTNLTADVAPTFNLTYSGSTGTRTVTWGVSNIIYAPNITVTAGGDTFTTGGTTTLRNLTFTGFTGTLGNATREIYGNLTLVSGMATPSSGSLVTTFNGVGSQTITTAGKTLDFPITFNGVGGTWQLQDALTSGATRTVTLANGTLDLASYTLTAGALSSNNSNIRTLAFGTGKLVLTTNNATVCSSSTATGLTVTGSKRVELDYSGSTGTRTILGATFATQIEGVNILDYYIISGADTIALSGSRAYGNVNFSNGGTSTFTGTFSAPTASTNIFGDLILNSSMSVGSGTNVAFMKSTSGTKTITSAGKTLDFPIVFDGIGGTWTCTDALTLGSTRTLTMTNGTLKLKSGVTSTVGAFATSGTNQKYLQSSTAGTQATISDASGTNDVSYLTIQDINATGGATWNSFYDQSNINAGNNAGWYFGDSPTVGNEIEMRLRSFTQPRRF